MTDDELTDQAGCIAATLSRLTRALSSQGADDPAVELPLAQLRVCNVLRDGPRTMSCLSRELHISQSAITQSADRLEKAGMIERVMEGEDRRVKLLRLTPRGEAMMRARRETRTRRIAEALARLAPAERQDICHSLQVLLAASLAAPEGQAAAPARDLVGE